MNIGSVNSGSNAYGTYGAGQLKTQAEPVADQAALKTGESQGGAQITALAKANELQKNIIDLIA
ncbi:hypothetical protein [Desulforegula conservatrix]|uniref:hypothetical protein n=1 Tax=Desulforegula conservatrix TaxID=153026 RepID=UPI00040418E5|nr:hypothetical protein [Desulforegula conservatrix]